MELCKRLIYLALIIIPTVSAASELTFELPDNAKQCFYQEIDKDTSAVLEYQVVSGGRHDVDCKIEDPDGLELYNEKKQQYGSHQWTTMKKGVYKVSCISQPAKLNLGLFHELKCACYTNVYKYEHRHSHISSNGQLNNVIENAKCQFISWILLS